MLVIARISYGNSVLLSWCLSQPGTDQSPGEIKTSGFHHMIAKSDKISCHWVKGVPTNEGEKEGHSP